MNCTSKVTTTTVEPCEPQGMVCLHSSCIVVDGVWQRITLHPLTCKVQGGHADHMSEDAAWRDDTPGATRLDRMGQR